MKEIDSNSDNQVTGINCGINSNLVGYCETCVRLQDFYYNLDQNKGWGNTCKYCKTFVPLNEFSQAILLCDRTDIVYSLEKSSKTLTKELLTKLIIVIEKFGERICLDKHIFDSIYDLLKTISLVVLLSGLAISTTIQMEVIKNFQIYQQSLIK
jgi:hypothetical protein